MKLRRLQFSLRTLLVAAFVIPLAIAGLNHVRLNNPAGFREMVFWAIVVSGALALRPVGALIGRRIGHVAHHSLSWFLATLGAAITILAINAVYTPALFFEAISSGLVGVSLIGGMIVGTFVELGCFLLMVVWAKVGG